LFIMPGYRFRAIHVLLTTLHLPRSTPLMFVAARAGYLLAVNVGAARSRSCSSCASSV
jgi:S-adenosylmethionine:tRNA-ribosyltransferase-isomerase (queuine synthetase)